MEHTYGTYAARLASFLAPVAVSPKKKRASNTKGGTKAGTRTVSWPHQTPTPERLALAGLYYRPSSTSHDNTVCFLCGRQLDGWEEDDDPVTEHLKHSSECAWAIITDVSQNGSHAEPMEDPTERRMVEARKATFELGWPHESKRGWTCKVAKMVDAGFHFAPTPECDDFVSCAYCKVSLDGWEPKDNPFEEHHRRSPECAFFAFAGTTAAKPGQKKGRTSKASRASTQSNVTVASEIPSIPDLDESIDTSTTSVMSTTSGIGKKKTTRGKSKLAKAKIVEVPVEEPEGTAKAAGGTKRTSDQISGDERGSRESTVRPEPPAKRRNTRTRGSIAEQINYPVLAAEPPGEGVDMAEAPAAKKGRKRTSSRSRQVSAASTASLRAGIPDDAAIEAALEAELERMKSDEEQAVQKEEPKPKRGRPKKTAASTAHSRSIETAGPDGPRSDAALHHKDHVDDVHITYDTDAEAASKPKGRKPCATKKAASKKTAQKARTSEESNGPDTNGASNVESSVLTANTIEDDSGHETDASVAGKSIGGKGSKRKAGRKGRGKKAGSGMMSKNIEDIVQSQTQNTTMAAPGHDGDMEVDAQIAELNDEIDAEDEAEMGGKASKIKQTKKATTAKSKTKKAADRAPQLSMPGAFSPLMPEHSPSPSFASVLSSNSPAILAEKSVRQHMTQIEDEMEVIPPERESTPTPRRVLAPAVPPRSSSKAVPIEMQQRSTLPRPSPSPLRHPQENGIEQMITQGAPSPPASAQSSDAENAPPSSRPANKRPPVPMLSPTKTTRIPLVLGTPSSANIPVSPNKIAGGLTSQMPWKNVDVEMIFVNTPGPEKENVTIWNKDQVGDLTDDEKNMTVEEWIYHNAQRAEEELKREAERVVSIFEREGQRAMAAIEGIECV